MFKDICFEIASAVWMHPELASLLNRASETSHLKAIIVTCGLKKTWEKVLQLAKLDDAVQVIRGGRLRDGYVVDEAVKAHLVSPSKQELSISYVWAFGDSALDLEMPQEADQAVIVVGDESRSHSIMDALAQALKTTQLRARQALLSSSVRPRLDCTSLPQCDSCQGRLHKRAPAAAHGSS